MRTFLFSLARCHSREWPTPLLLAVTGFRVLFNIFDILRYKTGWLATLHLNNRQRVFIREVQSPSRDIDSEHSVVKNGGILLIKVLVGY